MKTEIKIKNKIIEILKSKCNGCDLPLSLDVEYIADLLIKEFIQEIKS